MPNPGRWQLKPCGKTGGSSVHPTAGFFLLAAASFAQDPLPCTDHSLAGGFLEVQQWGNLHQSCLGSADGKLVKLVKIFKKGLKEYAISPAEFSCHGITISDHGSASGEGRSASSCPSSLQISSPILGEEKVERLHILMGKSKPMEEE